MPWRRSRSAKSRWWRPISACPARVPATSWRHLPTSTVGDRALENARQLSLRDGASTVFDEPACPAIFASVCLDSWPGHDIKSAACDSVIVDRRLSDGTFGVYYCATELETAIGETVHHFEAFARDSGDPARMEDMRVLAGAVAEDFEDVAALAEPYRRQVLDPHDCSVAQTYARGLRDAGAMGAVHASVRRAS